MKASLTTGKGWRAAIAVVALIVLGACTQKMTTERPPEPGDKAVARVNGSTVWASDVKREAVAQGLIGRGEPLDLSSDLFRQVLEQVEDQKLMAVEAIRRKIDKDPETQRRMAAARERILGDILLERTVDRAINEKTMSGLYQEFLKLRTPAEEIHLRQILVATPVEAEAVRKALLTGGSFDILASERSKDEATRFKGGALPPMTSDMLPEAYAAPLKDAKAGQIVGPFKTDDGWVVARLDERKLEAAPPLEEARPQIIRFITYDQVKDLLLTLRARAKVETLIAPPADGPGAAKEPASAPATPPLATPPPATPPAVAPSVQPAGGLRPAQPAKPQAAKP